MFQPSEALKKLLSNTERRLAKALKEGNYAVAECYAEHLFRQLMQINDADALKPEVLAQLNND